MKTRSTRKERPYRSTKNGDKVDKAKRDVVSEGVMNKLMYTDKKS